MEFHVRSGPGRAMPLRTLPLAIAAIYLSYYGNDSKGSSPTPVDSMMSFFVTSARSATGNLGGLRAADGQCQNLANAAGAGTQTWRAYLSVEHDATNGNRPVDARSRIG